MRQVYLFAAMSALFLSACSSTATPTQSMPQPTPAATQPALPQNKGTLPVLPPQGKLGTPPALPPQAKQGTLPAPKETGLPPRGQGETAQPTSIATVTNPTGGAKLYVAVFVPKNATGKLPTVILVPGGTGDSAGFTQVSPRGDADVTDYNNAGFIAVVFDPDGRGKSNGSEDYNGHRQQDGLAAVVRYVAALPQVDAQKIGIHTYSYGITLGSGALARYSDPSAGSGQALPVKYLIDWEGPADRNYTTTGCTGGPTNIQWQPCSNNAWWSEREAVNFIGKLRVPYQRVQSEKDHVQSTNAHAVDMINAAIKGGVPWVRLNDYAVNQTYDPKNQPKMLPEAMDAQREQVVIKYAQELMKK